MNSKKECVEYSQQYKNACCIVQCVVDQAIAHQDSGWATTLYTSSYGYVLFTNGYWDFKGCRFVAMDSPEFDDSIRFLEQIPFDYKEEMGAQNAARVQHTLFLEPFGPRVAEYFIRQLARGLAGDAIKRFLVGIGPSNTGKSILTGALRSACGSYFGDWTGANLVDRHTSQDGGQQMRWLMLLRTKRIVVSNELKTRQSLDSNTMKVMSSGGEDGITGREHGCNEQQGVTMRLLPILFAQDLPKISPIDDALSNRIRAIPYSKVYVDKPSNALELKKDPGLVSDIKTEAFRMGLLHVLFDAYTRFHQSGQVEEEIDEIREAVTDVIGAELNIVDSFKLHFEITNDPAHFVSSKVIQAWLTDGKYNVTITKLGMELKRYIQINNMTNVCNKNKKIDRKTVMVWHGIREFPEEE
jgi:phage/plasmid-associated DNA primase